MLSFTYRQATWPKVLLVALLFVVGSTLIFSLGPYPKVQEIAQQPMPEEEMGYSVQHFQEFLTVLGVEGRALYFAAQVWDILLPLLMGSFLIMLIAWLLRQIQAANASLRWLAVLPVLFITADLGENIIILAGLNAFPDISPSLEMLPILTGLKFGGLLLTGITVLLAGILAIYKQWFAR